MHTIIHALLIILLIVGSSCNKLIEVKAPVTSINANNVFQTDATAIAVMTDVYAQMSAASITAGDIGLTGISAYAGLSADELVSFDSNNLIQQSYQNNNLLSNIPGGAHFWNKTYQVINTCNIVLENTASNQFLTPAVNKQLRGEANFIRAFCFFYLTNLYGAIPLTLTSDYQTNKNLPKTSGTVVYRQIIKDLQQAEELLSLNYLDASLLEITPEKIRPTKAAAAALLARVYLFTKDYVNAEARASFVIDSSFSYHLAPLNKVFLKNSSEAIWQLQPVFSGSASNTIEGFSFILPSGGPNYDHPFYLRKDLVKSFEEGDMRKKNWIDSITASGITYYYPFKYKIGEQDTPNSEYSMVLRLSEQYLIRAEARTHQGKIIGGNSAQSDLNAVRLRADLPETTAADEITMVNAIINERKSELFTEWGNRWFDLKRLEKADEILGKLKEGDWQSTDVLYPIPQYEINKNPSLKGQQNPGYN